MLPGQVGACANRETGHQPEYGEDAQGSVQEPPFAGKETSDSGSPCRTG